MLVKSSPLVVVLALLATGCATTPPPAPPAAATAAVPAAAFNAHLWYRTSAERRAQYVQAYRLATARIEQRAARGGPAWGVILDIDETILDTSAYQVRAAKEGFTEDGFAAWCLRKEGTALPGARAFLERVHALGGKIALVSNRTAALCPATRENLTTAGLPFDEVICRDGESNDKNPRFVAIQRGTAPSTLPALEIALWVGDNIQDFPGQRQDELRRAPDDAFSEFGTRFISLPNPMYGSWQKNRLE